MRHLSKICVFAVVLVCMSPLFGCDGDSPTLPTRSGTLLVSVATAGTSLDPDGYTIAVRGGTTITAMVSINDTLRYTLPTGPLTVGISGLAANCGVNEDLWTRSIVNNSVSEAPFAVACITP